MLIDDCMLLLKSVWVLVDLFCHCKWTQCDLIQAFRSQLVILVRELFDWLDLVLRTIGTELQDDIPWGGG